MTGWRVLNKLSGQRRIHQEGIIASPVGGNDGQVAASGLTSDNEPFLGISIERSGIGSRLVTGA